MTKFKDLIEKINKDEFQTLEGIINHLITSKAITNGLLIVDFNEEVVRSIYFYERHNLKFKDYDIVTAVKKDKVWKLTIATEEQRKNALDIMSQKQDILL